MSNHHARVRQCRNTDGKGGTIASLAVFFLRGAFVVVSQQDAAGGSVEDWATESLLAAREAHVDPANGTRIKPGAKLGEEYQAKNLPFARDQLYRAGMRLAKVLNAHFE
jgi:hypothetical protein